MSAHPSEKGLGAVTIPISSALSCRSTEADQETANFKLDAHIHVTVNENRKGDDPPPDSQWLGPWFAVDIPDGVLDFGTTHTRPGTDLPPRYTPSRCDVRVTASLSPTTVINCSPCYTHTEVVVEEELTPRRWDISTHLQLGEEDNRGGGVLWEYTRRPGLVDAMAETISPTPKAVLGYNRGMEGPMPTLEVEVAVHWSLRSRRLGWLYQWVPYLRPSTPEISEVVHRASVVVDLAKVPPLSLAAGHEAFDKLTRAQLVAAEEPISFEPLSMGLVDRWDNPIPGNEADSDGKVLFKRAIERRLDSYVQSGCADVVPFVLPGPIRRLLHV